MSAPSCHCILLRNAARKVSAAYDEALAPFGINIAQFSLLRNIGRLQPVSLTELAGRVELDRSTVGRNVKVLERMGLAKIGHGDDQREALLSLADRGRALLEQAEPAWRDVQQRLEQRLGADDTKKLRELLAAL